LRFDPALSRCAELPLLATDTQKQEVKQKNGNNEGWALTADVDGRVESLGNLRVHLDVELLLGRELFVAVFDLRPDPASEGLAEDGVGDVDEPLAGYLVHVPVFGQVVVDAVVLASLVENALDAEVLVLGAVEVLHSVALDTI